MTLALKLGLGWLPINLLCLELPRADLSSRNLNNATPAPHYESAGLEYLLSDFLLGQFFVEYGIVLFRGQELRFSSENFSYPQVRVNLPRSSRNPGGKGTKKAGHASKKRGKNLLFLENLSQRIPAKSK